MCRVINVSDLGSSAKIYACSGGADGICPVEDDREEEPETELEEPEFVPLKGKSLL